MHVHALNRPSCSIGWADSRYLCAELAEILWRLQGHRLQPTSVEAYHHDMAAITKSLAAIRPNAQEWAFLHCKLAAPMPAQLFLGAPASARSLAQPAEGPCPTLTRHLSEEIGITCSVNYRLGCPPRRPAARLLCGWARVHATVTAAETWPMRRVFTIRFDLRKTRKSWHDVPGFVAWATSVGDERHAYGGSRISRTSTGPDTSPPIGAAFLISERQVRATAHPA